MQHAVHADLWALGVWLWVGAGGAVEVEDVQAALEEGLVGAAHLHVRTRTCALEDARAHGRMHEHMLQGHGHM